MVARALRDAGMEVIYTGIRQTPQMIVQAAAQEDVDVVGISILSGAHMEILPEILSLLKEQGMEDVVTIVGGIVPDADRQSLSESGVSGVFGPTARASRAGRLLRMPCRPFSGAHGAPLLELSGNALSRIARVGRNNRLALPRRQGS